ncbi:GlxA family transcriptional regulator [Oceanicola sp. D3]|uniref:GlxA family transcriptional regulator n=1 Tax=Oceanicola sp. D3 TaxID=2587163 RepID=UPI001122F475|nr:GlxA family transcriptional regulator [Oceanicola sp. D3]QDC11605.1 GlxA family transcriptional regulator [Oceanicola sp. D3]
MRRPEAQTLVVEVPAKPKRFAFLLVPDFSLLSFAGAIDAFRLANRTSGNQLYDWQLISEGAVPVQASCGSVFQVNGGLDDLNREEVILACAGLDVEDKASPKILAWLRKQARRGLAIGGLCTAGYLLARAGLLDGKRATIHWENADSFTEEFEEVRLTKTVFVHDGNRMTTAGGTASIDLALQIIAEDYGEELANTVADQLIYSSIRTDQDTQRLSIPTRIGVRHPKLSRVIQIMEQNLEEPISPAKLAEDVVLSTRQLERLFRRYLNRSPKRYYMELRLQKARNLLMQTDMSVINVALACGFTSPSHFSKCYRAQYQTTPYRERGSHGARLSV